MMKSSYIYKKHEKLNQDHDGLIKQKETIRTKLKNSITKLIGWNKEKEVEDEKFEEINANENQVKFLQNYGVTFQVPSKRDKTAIFHPVKPKFCF